MSFLIKLLVLVTIVECAIAGYGENSENSLASIPPQPPLPLPPTEESRFKKFLSLFGISSSSSAQLPNQHLDRSGELARAYQQYGYPCVIPTTTTTTPSPMRSPFLCPYPPMLPAQNLVPQPNQYGGHVQPSSSNQVPVLPPNYDQLHGVSPPPPQGGHFPPHHINYPNGKPTPSHSPLPELLPQSPAPGYPPQLLIPPGLKPGDHLRPTPPSFPNENFPNPNPIQNLPQPVQPVEGGPGGSPLPTFPGPLLPSNIGPTENPIQPVDPTLVTVPGVDLKPVGSAEVPVKVNPVPSPNPINPVKVTPSNVDPSKPVQVNPINFNPINPVVVDPVLQQQLNSPLLVNPSNDQPLLVDPINKPSLDSKGFSKYPPHFLPYGHLNVLINPGIPEKVPQSTKPVPEVIPEPLKFDIATKPGKIPKPPVGNEPFFTNGINGLPLHDGYTIIGPIQGPLNPNLFNGNSFLIGTMSPNGVSQLPPAFNLPPTTSSSSSPNNINLGFPSHQVPNKLRPIPPPPNVNNSTGVSSNGGQYLPPTTFVPSSFPPSQPLDTFTGVSPCGSSFMKSYVPPGFHLTSVNQFIGIPTVPNSRVVYPCPTVEILKALDFKIMRSLIIESGLAPLFEHTRNYTLFVPSDVAFRRLPRWFRDSLEVDKKLKKALVLNHFVKEDLSLDMLENEELVLTGRPGGHRIRINIYQPGSVYRTITVDGSEVEKGDLLTSNGRIHIVNKVLMPNLPRNAAQFLSEKLEFESFWNLIKQAELIEDFQHPRPFTVFIPVNEAVQKLNDPVFFADKDKLRNFINYHVVNGTYYSNGLINNEFLLTNYEKEIKLQVVSDSFARSLSGINGNVRILKSDITLTNGVAHIIDKCISEDSPFYVYPQSDEFRNEYGVMKRSFRVTGEEKNISGSF